MKVLLDTHVFLWAITDAPQLSLEQRELFLDQGTDLYLSVVSVWEMLISLSFKIYLRCTGTRLTG